MKVSSQALKADVPAEGVAHHRPAKLCVPVEVLPDSHGEHGKHVDVATVNPSLLLKYAKLPVLNPFNCSGQASMALLDELMATASVIGRGN